MTLRPTIVRLCAAAVATLLVAAGLVAGVQPAAAVTYIACGDVLGPSGLVASVERGNTYRGGTVTIYLTPGCIYQVPEPAWDFDPYGNKIYTESAFWQLNNTRGWDNTLVVEGNGATITRSASAGRFRFFDIGHLGEVVLKNLTLTGGQSIHAVPDGYQHSANAGHGGGAISNAGVLTLENVTLTNNTTGNGENGDNGGSGDGDPGGAGGNGGAIVNSGTLTITNSTLSGNTTGVGGAGGNGLVNGGQGGSGGNGGAIYNTGTLTITATMLSGNSTGWAGSAGSGIYGGPPAARGSGGAIAGGGSVTIRQSLLSANNAEGTLAAVGGAVALTNGQLAIDNSTLVGNKAWRAGALYLSGGTATIRSATFTGNDATGTGDQITGDVAAMDRGATMTFSNTVMYANDPTQVDCNIQVWAPAVTYASRGGLISDESSGCGTNTVVADPQLQALGSYGGATQSLLPTDSSPLLGAGVASECLAVDQRGTTRPAVGCDVGAVERLSVPTGAISGPAIVAAGTPKGFTSTATVGGAPLAYRWSVTGVPAAISSASAASPQITFTASGHATVNLNVRPVGSSDAESIDLPSLTVSVPPSTNQPPQVSWVGPAITSVDEGDVTRFEFAVTDPDGDAWSLLPGSPSCGTAGTLLTSALTATGGFVECSFPNGLAASQVSVKAVDAWQAESALTTTVTVAEVAPTITVTAPAQADEGSIVVVSYAIHEPGTDTFFPVATCTGAGSTKIAGTDSYTPGGHDTTGSFQCRVGNGPSTVTASVTANGGVGTAAIQSRNVAPSIAITGTTPADENAGFSATHTYRLNATDPADTALTLVPGSASCGATGTVVSATVTAIECRFASAPGTAVISATVEDPDGARSTGGSLTVSVANVAPVVTVSQPTGPVDEGATAYFSLTATDAGHDPLTLSVDPGCAVLSESRPAAGRLTATISCTYTDGPATVSRTVQVSDGKTSTTATIANQVVANVAPSITAQVGNPSWEYGTATLTLGAISDPGPDTVTSAVIHWGDGATDTVAWPPAQSTVTHSYIDSGTYHPTIDLVDEDGTHTGRGPWLTQVVGVTIPTIQVTVPPAVYEYETTTFHFSAPVASSGTYTVDSATCGRDDTSQFIYATNITTTSSGGSLDCVYPIGARTQTLTLQVTDPSGTYAYPSHTQITVLAVPPVVQWTGGPAVVNEGPTTAHRFTFHAEDNGPLGVALLSFKPNAGLTPASSCGTGGTIVAGPVLDPATGDGYLDCVFSRGPATARVEIYVTDFIGYTVASVDVTVLNVAPVVTLTVPAGVVREGETAVFTYAASDVSGEAVTASHVDCGADGQVVAQSAGAFSCVFDDGPQTHAASVTVTDGDDEASDTVYVFVDNAAPTAVAVSGSSTFDVGSAYTLTIGATTDAGDDTPNAWQIHWGDGSTSSVTALTPLPTHVYTSPGQYVVTVDVTDEDGTYPAIGTLTVRNIDRDPPVLTVPDDTTMEGNGTDGLYWDWPRSAIDDRDGAVPITCTGPTIYGYNFFAVGTTTYDCTATDAAGNVATAQFSVTVTDTTAPTFVVPTSDRISATSSAGATVTWDTQARDAVDWRIPAVCDAVSGAQFAMGTHTVHCAATDRAGNTGVLVYSFEVGDFSGPVLALGSSLVEVDAVDETGAVATYAEPTAWDALDGDTAVDCTPASGSLFALGDTTVTCTAQDEAGNLATADFTVRVTDVTAPVITPPADLVVAPTSAAGATATWLAPLVTDNVDHALTATCTPASGSLFALGQTVVECTVSDAAGNGALAQFTVTVQDEQAPVVTVPADLVVEATGPDPQAVTYDPVTATDLVDGSVAVSCDVASGADFALGTTRVTCEASDSEGNLGTASFTVTVADTTAPTVTAPADLSVEATGPSTAVSFGAATATDLVDGTVAATCTPASGHSFGFGATTVTCSATDAAGNTGSAVFAVTITDTTAPTITAADVVVGATSASGATVAYAIAASDLVDGAVAVDCTPASGSLFASESATLVSCSAEDGHGNTATASFTVTVSGAVLTADLAPGDTEAFVSVEVFTPGDYVVIDEGTPNEEVRLVDRLGSIIVAAPFARSHLTGAPVRVVAAPLADTTAPTITASVPSSIRRGTAASVTASCADAGVGVERCVIPAVDTSALGTFTVTVLAWDRNGNTSSRSLQYTVVGAGGLAATGTDFAPLAAALLLMLAGMVLIRRRRRT